MKEHIHPDVRSIVSEHAKDVSMFKAWKFDGGAKIHCSKISYTGVRELNEAGYLVGGIQSWGIGTVRMFIEKK